MKTKLIFNFFFIITFLNIIVAQDEISKKSPIQAGVAIVTGSYYPFFEKNIVSEYYPNLIPYTIGFMGGVSLQEPHGRLLLQTGFIMDRLSMNYQYHQIKHCYKAIMAHFPVSIAYDYRINPTFSVLASCGIHFTRFLSYNKTVTNAKPTFDYLNLDNCWSQILGYSIVGSVGFNYWFHPHFGLQVSPYFRYYFNCPLEAEWILRPTIGLHVCVNWAS